MIFICNYEIFANMYFSFSPGMRILVMLLLDTLPMLGNVLLLCFFVFFIFGIIGVQLWAGVLRNRCFLNLSANISVPLWVWSLFCFCAIIRTIKLKGKVCIYLFFFSTTPLDMGRIVEQTATLVGKLRRKNSKLKTWNILFHKSVTHSVPFFCYQLLQNKYCWLYTSLHHYKKSSVYVFTQPIHHRQDAKPDNF